LDISLPSSPASCFLRADFQNSAWFDISSVSQASDVSHENTGLPKGTLELYLYKPVESHGIFHQVSLLRMMFLRIASDFYQQLCYRNVK